MSNRKASERIDEITVGDFLDLLGGKVVGNTPVSEADKARWREELRRKKEQIKWLEDATVKGEIQ